MLLSLVDSLRCPGPHEASSLVLSVEQWTEQRIAEGVLGCPMCHARYPIHRGVADFSKGVGVVRPPDEQPRADAMRLAAQLALADGGGVVLLTGRYAAAHEALL